MVTFVSSFFPRFLTLIAFSTQRQSTESTDFWLQFFTGWHNIVATAPLVMANAANLTSLVPTMAAIGCASELLKLVPCIQLRDKKFEILVLHSTIIRQCPQAELISYRFLPSFSTATVLQNQPWAGFGSVFQECHFPKFLFFFLQGGRADSSGSSSPTFSGLASQETERLQVLQETCGEGHLMLSSKPLTLGYQGHEFSFPLIVNDSLWQISMPRFCKSLATSSFNISTESQLSFRSLSFSHPCSFSTEFEMF